MRSVEEYRVLTLIMIFINIFRLSIRNFKNMKLRSMLTVLGIGIGIGAILFLVALGQGLQKLLVTRITTAEALLTLDVSPIQNSSVVLDKSTVEMLRSIETVNDLSSVKSEKARISFQGVSAGVTAYFIEDNFFRLSGLDKLLQDIQTQDINAKQTSDKNHKEINFKNKDGVIVSKTILALLSIKEEELIQNKITLQISDEKGLILEGAYKVFSIINDDTSFVYLPSKFYPSDKLTVYNNLKIQAKSTVFIEKLREYIITKGFMVSALSDTVRQANRVFKIMQVILGVFGAIALLVAAIGMFNTMTIALLERTNEIGIMRAIGASRLDIWLMFLFESFTIGFFGGLSGIGIGIGIAEFANQGLNFLASRLGGESLDIFYYPIWFVIGILIFSTVVAIITGFYPARRAANLNPLQALRYK